MVLRLSALFCCSFFCPLTSHARRCKRCWPPPLPVLQLTVFTTAELCGRRKVPPVMSRETSNFITSTRDEIDCTFGRTKWSFPSSSSSFLTSCFEPHYGRAAGCKVFIIQISAIQMQTKQKAQFVSLATKSVNTSCLTPS